jgi:hypothetical protein
VSASAAVGSSRQISSAMLIMPDTILEILFTFAVPFYLIAFFRVFLPDFSENSAK